MNSERPQSECADPQADLGVSCSYMEYMMFLADGTTCSVAVSDENTESTLTDVYTYNTGLTPEISSVDPPRGGTGGGTTITVTGSGFG